MTTAKTLLTVDDLLRLPDDGYRYELLDGELRRMTPAGGAHGKVENNVAYAITGHVRPRGLGHVFTGDTGITLRHNPDRVRAPDVCFITYDRLPPDQVPAGYLEAIPDFVVEVISPNDTATEVQEKVEEWLDAGVRLVWAVYAGPRSIVAYRSRTNVRLYTAAEVIDAAPVLPDFSCPVSEFFA